MTVDVKQIDELVRELAVTIPASEVDAVRDRLFAAIQQDAEIKGYRKGKAPLAMIKSMFGEKVQADLAEELINSSIRDALTQQSFRLATKPELRTANFGEDGHFAYTAVVEVFPDIPQISFDTLTYPRIEIEIKDEEVAEVVELLRRRNAEFRPVSRAATTADLVNADMTKVSDPGNVLTTDTFDDVKIDLENPMTVRELRDGLVGVSAGDVREITVRYGEDYSDPKFAGKEIGYRVSVKNVQERVLPEVDDAFSKSTGIGETALEMKMKIREDLIQRRKQDLRKFQKNELAKQIVLGNPIPIPPSYIIGYLDAMVEEMKRENGDADEQELRTTYRETALNTLRWELLYQHIADQERIEVSHADTETMIRSLADQYQMTTEEATRVLKQSGRLERMKDSILEGKVFDLLLDRARPVTPPKP